jgi:hypothetical protein
MDENEDEFRGRSLEYVQGRYFLETLPAKHGRYEFKKRGIDAAAGAVVLFQYKNEIIASATLDRVEKLQKAMYFDPTSIKVFKPVTHKTIEEIWPKVEFFSNSKWDLDGDGMEAFEQGLEAVKRPKRSTHSQEADDEAPSDLSEHAATAQVARPLQGDKLYQGRAREALPLLVRQAEAGVPIFYSDLAAELGMPNPRNLNYVLGSIGQTLEHLAEQWSEKIPPIQCLVLNKQTGLPGAGVGWFLRQDELSALQQFSELTLRQKREMIQAELLGIYSYSRWREVLVALSLEPSNTDLEAIVAEAGHAGGGEETPQHKALKYFVANNPEIVGLPSGDCLDVSFTRKNIWVAAEVKSSISNDADLARGLFQCVKYLAVMEANLIADAKPANARVVLVLESSLPSSLVPLKNLLGIEVVERVNPDVDE